jgi:radical SAM protein with 4Fe4S-binding SPASM domain
VHKCLDIGKRERLPHWHIRYVPLCYFQDYLDQVSELDEVKKFQTEHIAPDFTNLDVESSRAEVGRVKGKQCRQCKLNDVCEGIWRKYVEHYGVDELKPILS